jgi:hypothetical protein
MPKYYHTCEECPLSVFILCLEKEDPQYLVIEGPVPAEDLSIAWANLFAEFMDLTEDNEQMYILHLQREVNLLAQEIYEVDTVLYFLQPVMLFASEGENRHELLNVLKRYDYPYEMDFKDIGYVAVLENITNRISSKRLQFEMKAKELVDYAKEKSLDSFDKNYFYRQLSRLAKFQRVAVIRPKDITVLEFVILDKEYQKANNSRRRRLN